MQLHSLTIHELRELMDKKEVTSQEITQACLDRISEFEDQIGAFLTITKEEALAEAKQIDEKRMRGESLAPLAGIPMAVADHICTAGIKTTAASKILDNYLPPVNATAVERLKNAGAILMGKSNLDEFALGISTENSAFFPTKNPFDFNTVAGGACGGSAAAVASGEAVFALGADTGGDIRQPAAFCGLIGFKPTYGAVSRSGLISHASSLDQIGPFARDMTDLALILNTICCHDAKDSTSAKREVPDFTGSLRNDVQGLKIGLPQEYLTAGVAPEVEAKLREAIRKLEELGASVVEVSLPHIEYATGTHFILSSAEASSNLARYDGVRHGLRVEAEDVLHMFNKTRSQGFGAAVRNRILLGTYVLSTANYQQYYTEALKVRTLIKQDFDRVLAELDCLLTPTSLKAAPPAAKQGDPAAVEAAHFCTLPANLAGLPAISLPYGLAGGLPVGLQLIARHFEEQTLLRIGYTLEQNTDQTRPIPGLGR